LSEIDEILKKNQQLFPQTYNKNNKYKSQFLLSVKYPVKLLMHN